MKKIAYLLCLLLLTVFVWQRIYAAQFLEYDLNYGQLLVVFFLSVGFLLTGVILIIKKVDLIMRNLLVTVVFLVVNSPLSIFLIVMNYKAVFGVALDVG